ncbi:hypothetical protein ODJ79_29205 [Actinoplanes sp. KI2]|uniref:hypothetical protein n=1 Tax=Actinoplanes sp. KI2 TaxID=2983315 RepID=UPI0021D58F9E|nr:hypothetical protein [Actinoplanes sp. KI2]MCU7727814.1 hypothetical protein [Actinoplanes sp. KI2]
MRTWRATPTGQDEADRLVGGDRSDPGLDHLLDALRAPATPGELGGEREVVAALATERRRAALTERPEGRVRVRVPKTTRTLVVSIATGLAVLSVGGTAVAAGTGNLPDGLQQRAHRLFSALGVPAPRTGPTAVAPTPSGAASPTPSPTATPTPTPTPEATATATPSTAQVAAWCMAWQTAENGGKPMPGRTRRDLIKAAGGADEVADYCARAGVSATPATGATKPGGGSSRRATPSHPTPHAVTPSHPGPNR